jgi:anti-anti-sigma factor
VNSDNRCKRSDQIQIGITKIDDILLAELTGTLDCMAAGAVYDALVQPIDENTCRLIVDMSGVTRLTRAGVRGLVVAAKLCTTAGGKMRICSADAPATRLLNNLGFRHLLRLEPNVEAARIALNATGKCRSAGALPAPAAWPEGSVPEHQFNEINRVERARGLIEADELPIDDVAANCGFRTVSAMDNAFLRHLGIPSRYFAQRAATARELPDQRLRDIEELRHAILVTNAAERRDPRMWP